MRADYSRKKREAWQKREENGLGTRANGALQAEVQARISESVKKAWDEGRYDDRVNGMTGVTGAAAAGWTWGRIHFHSILKQFEPPVCAFCGETETLNVHHIDEDHDNYLLSNFQWACVPCHAWRFHYADERRGRPPQRVKQPFVTLTKDFRFEYAHILPWHPGKCSRLHGHSGRLSVSVRGRIDPHGVVEDFYDISAATKIAVVEPLDHRFLNDWLLNPTTEELLVFIWHRLESIGLKGLREIAFSETDSSRAILTAADMVEAFGWDRDEDDTWQFVRKTTR
jgi:6-pyruvoyltetrahydropterin/6-carboxytetrahydropterin synthase